MEYGIVQRPKAGNLVSGDATLVREEGPRIVIAVSDGLGSGGKASQSSRMAIQGVADNLDAPLADIMAYCHYTILAAGGVGVMMTLLRLDQSAGHMEFSGVGNIRFLAHSRQVIQPITRYGYLGVRLPSLRVLRFDYTPGDVFVLHTDGISSRFHVQNHLPDLVRGPQALADLALREYSKAYDDATMVVVKA